MEIYEMPNELKRILKGTKQQLVLMGDTADTVIRYEKNEQVYFLKTGKKNHESQREHDMLKWLNGKLLVPDILFWNETETTFYLLTSPAQGTMACTERGLSSEEDEIIYALADGLLQFQGIEISSCPLENKLEQRLDAALFNIENNLVNLDDFACTFSENKRFQTPIQLYEYLLTNKPEEELHLTHGDFCLPNIFVTRDKATGFIDMGRGGTGDKYQDIALCLRSLRYNTFKNDDKSLLFDVLGITPDWEKIDYYILLDELF